MTDNLRPPRGRSAAVTWFFAIAALTLLLDLGAKWYVFTCRRFAVGTVRPLIPGVLTLHVSWNPGAAFGFGKGWGTLLVLIALVAAAGIIWAAFKYGPASRLLTAALGLLLGGAAGNVWDRLLHGGQVRDFIDLHLGSLHWPGIFNIADAAITIGCCLVVLSSFRTPRKVPEQPAPAGGTKRKSPKKG